MDRIIYLTMAGAKATLQRQEIVANNLANASTQGFRADLTAFRAVPVLGDGASTRVYAIETTPAYNDEPGHAQATGRGLDVAMRGKSWLAVQASDGTETYTRAGSLDVSSDGTLVTRAGLAVLGDGGPITVPAGAELNIGADGSISAKVGNGTPTTVGRLKLVTPQAPLTRGADGLFRAPQGELPADANARLQDGALEGSNVSAIESMVAMISAARQFEQQLGLIKAAQEKEQQAAKLLGS